MRDPKKKSLDETDYLILTLLSSNCKMSLKMLSKKTGLPSSTLFARIKKLEEKGVIRGYTIKVDPEALGYGITAVIHFSVDGPYLEEVERNLSRNPNIIFLYDVTGDFDIIAVARFKSIHELDYFIKNTLKNPHIKRSITNMALRVVKEKQPTIPMEEEEFE